MDYAKLEEALDEKLEVSISLTPWSPSVIATIQAIALFKISRSLSRLVGQMGVVTEHLDSIDSAVWKTANVLDK